MSEMKRTLMDEFAELEKAKQEFKNAVIFEIRRIKLLIVKFFKKI